MKGNTGYWIVGSILGAAIFGLSLTIVVIVRSRSVPNYDAQTNTTTADPAYIRKLEEEQRRVKERSQEEADRTNRIATQRNDTIAKMCATPKGREETVAACFKDLKCTQPEMDAVIARGADAKERDRLKKLSFAESVAAMARKAKDGFDMSMGEAAAIAMILKNEGQGVLDLLPKTSIGEASKDTDDNRGKTLRASGSVVQIRGAGSGSARIYEGTLATDNGKFIYFFCPFSTDGIVDGTYAGFRGVFLQEYSYKNTGGGVTHSLLAIGHFTQ